MSVLIWVLLTGPFVAIAVRDVDGGVAFALALAGPIGVLGLGYAVGSLVFHRLVTIRRAPE